MSIYVFLLSVSHKIFVYTYRLNNDQKKKNKANVLADFLQLQKKSIQYKLIKVFSINFHDFFLTNLSTIRLLPQLQVVQTFSLPDIEIIVFKSFKPIRTRSNDYNIFTTCLTNNSVRQYFSFDENKSQWRICSSYVSTFNRIKFKVMLTSMTCIKIINKNSIIQLNYSFIIFYFFLLLFNL